MDGMRKTVRKYYLRQVVACWVVISLLFNVPFVLATPNVSDAGGATVTTPDATHTNVLVNSDQTIMQWNSLDTDGDSGPNGRETLAFLQNEGITDAAVLNRVISGVETNFNGTLNAADGMFIFVINPAGVIFGAGSQVNVTDLVASSLNLSDTDFANEVFNFAGGGIGNVENHGTITAEKVALIGKNVINKGIVSASDLVIMAAGDSVVLSGDENIVVTVAMADVAAHVVDNGGDSGTGGGAIHCDGGQVILAAGDVFSAAIDGIESLRAEAKRDAVIEGSIDAYAYGNSDAVSTVDVIAGGDATVNGSINVETELWTGDPEDDTISTINIDAGGDATINGRLKAKADTWYSGDATATVDISADGDVAVNDKVEAWTHSHEDSGSALSQVNITAGQDVTVAAEIKSGGAHTNDSSGSATANIGIDAGGDVGIIEDGKLKTDAHANDDSGDARTAVDITAGGDVGISGRGIEAKAHSNDQYDTLSDSEAKVSIDAGGDVTVDSQVKADAHSNDYAGDATAGVEINADGDVIITGDGGDEEVYAEAYSEDSSGDAIATVAIDAGGDVTVTDSGESVEAEAEADYDSGDAKATIDIVAVGDVMVDGGGYTVETEAWTYDSSGDATATTNVTAGGDVIVENGGELYADAETGDSSGDAAAVIEVDADGDVLLFGGRIYGYSEAYDYSGDTASSVTVDAGGDVTLSRYDTDYDTEIESEAEIYDSGSATATTDIIAGGDVTVTEGEKSNIEAEARVENYAAAPGDATAKLTIDADGAVVVDDYGEIYTEAYVAGSGYEPLRLTVTQQEGDEIAPSGDASANITIHAIDDVIVGSDSDIRSDAWIDNEGEDFFFITALDAPVDGGQSEGQDATANVDIQTCGDVIADGLIGAYADIYDEQSGPDSLGDTQADVSIKAAGDVIVNEFLDDGYIIPTQLSYDGGYGYGSGLIEAVAEGGYENSADVTILACDNVIVNEGYGYDGLRVLDDGFGSAGEEIRAEATNGYTNDAHVGIAARDGDVEADGQIGAHTSGAWEDKGSSNTSNIEISAGRDVLVWGGYALYGMGEGPYLLWGEEGGQIVATAQDAFSNSASVDIFAGRDVIVEGAEVEFSQDSYIVDTLSNFESPYGGQIVAQTGWSNESTNTSTIGIYAQGDVIIDSATIIDEPVDDGFTTEGMGGAVIAGAHGDDSINTTSIEIGGQTAVTIDGEVSATSGTGTGGEHYADIAIAAGGELAGSGGIFANADPDASVYEDSITFFVTALSNILFDGETDPDYDTEVGPVAIPTSDFDWIDWGWCKECGEEEPVITSAPLYTEFGQPIEAYTFGLGGCPALMVWLGNELGIPPDEIQVFVAQTFASSTDIQPCDACARLKNAADILGDTSGTYAAALSQVVNEFVAPGAPIAPEQMASIASALANPEAGTQYATAAQWLDSMVQYVGIMTTEMGLSAGDSVAVVSKYITNLTGSVDTTVAAYVQARLAALGG